MEPLSKIVGTGIVLTLVSGCANTSLTPDIDPSADLIGLQSFYVAKLESDDRGIEQLIAAELIAMGKDATSGTEPNPPSPADALVTYEDKWFWDITMYMLELNIDLRDPETNYKFATARSYRTSLARKSKEEMVREVPGKLFEGTSAGGSK
jgi:hypothetical protein